MGTVDIKLDKDCTVLLISLLAATQLHVLLGKASRKYYPLFSSARFNGRERPHDSACLGITLCHLVVCSERSPLHISPRLR